jgi:predicted MFS family arabinose efflux permease
VFNGRFAVSALALGNFVIGLSILLPTGMLGELSVDLSIPIGTAGLLISLGAGVVCLSPPVVAWTTSQIDRRTVLSAIVLWLALGHMASAFAPNYLALLVIRLAMLAFAGGFTPLAASTMTLLVSEHERASAISKVLLGWVIAIAFGLPLITVIVPQIGWRAVHGLIGILAMVAFAALLIGLPNGVRGRPVNFATWRAVGRNVQLILLLLITVLLAAGQLVVVAFVGPLLSETTGANSREIAFVFLLFGVMTLVGNVIASQLVKSWSAFQTSAVFMVCILLGVSLWSIGTGVYSLMAVGAATWGLGFAAVTAMQQVRLIAAAPHLAVASVAINNTALYFGQAVGSGIGSFLFARGNLRGMGFVALALVAACMIVLWLTRNAAEKLGTALDFDTVKLLARAFDRALERHLRSLPTMQDDAILHAKLAAHIVATAQTGERDEDVLANNGYLMLQSIGISNSGDNSSPNE